MRGNNWVATSCIHCDFASDHRGMDRCGKCDGTGSQFMHIPTGERYPNTKTGWEELCDEHSDVEELAIRIGKLEHKR